MAELVTLPGRPAGLPDLAGWRASLARLVVPPEGLGPGTDFQLHQRRTTDVGVWLDRCAVRLEGGVLVIDALELGGHLPTAIPKLLLGGVVGGYRLSFSLAQLQTAAGGVAIGVAVAR